MQNDVTGRTSPSGSWLATTLIGIGIVLSTLTVYAQLREFSFVNFDDDVHVYENPQVNSGLTWDNAKWAFGIHGPSQWHPLSWLSHQLDVELFGLEPGGHHLTNLLFHTASAVLLFLTLKYATRELWPSAFVAIIFAVHPLNVESVAWISERRNVLSMFFGILTVLAYSWYVRNGGKARYALVVIVFALGLMAKPLLVTLPFVLFLLDYWPLRRIAFVTDTCADATATLSTRNSPCCEPGWRFLVLEKLPLLVLAVISSVLTVWCQQDVGTVASTEQLPMAIRLTNMLSVYGIYAGKVLWPVDLAVFYPHPGIWQPHPFSYMAVSAVIGTIFMIVVTAWSVVKLRKHPYLAVGWFWYLGTLVPMVGVVQVGRQQMADRYMYLPLIGLLMAMVWFVRAIMPARRQGRRFLWSVALSAIPACMAISWQQTSYWRDSVTLFRRTTAVTERNSWGHNNLGLALHEEGQSIAALKEFGVALRIDPDYALARYNLGVVWQDLGRSDRSVPHFQHAVQLNPAYVDAHLRLGAAFAQSNRLEDAIRHFDQAVQLAPSHPDAHLNLGIAYGRMANTTEAVAQFRIVLELRPDDRTARFGLATGLRTLGQPKEAEQQLRRFLVDVPDSAPAYCELGKLLLDKGEREQAVECFQQALQLDPHHIDAANQLKKIGRQS